MNCKFMNYKFMNYKFPNCKFTNYMFINYTFPNCKFPNYKFPNFKFTNCKFINFKFTNYLFPNVTLQSRKSVGSAICASKKCLLFVQFGNMTFGHLWFGSLRFEQKTSYRENQIRGFASAAPGVAVKTCLSIQSRNNAIKLFSMIDSKRLTSPRDFDRRRSLRKIVLAFLYFPSSLTTRLPIPPWKLNDYPSDSETKLSSLCLMHIVMVRFKKLTFVKTSRDIFFTSHTCVYFSSDWRRSGIV
jgi:hypothetical protein